MRRISSPTMPHAVAVLVVVSGIVMGAVMGAGTGQARAEDCLAGPNVTAPSGQHWYYRIDRAQQRKCWYLRGLLQGAHQTHSAAVAVNAKIDHPVFAAAMPLPVAPLPAANPPLPAPAAVTDNTSSLPHITVLAVKTVAVPALGASAETQARHRASEASITNERAYRTMPDGKSDATIFFVFLFGLGAATFLTAIVVKYAAPQASWSLRHGPVVEMRPSLGARGPSSIGRILGDRPANRVTG